MFENNTNEGSQDGENHNKGVSLRGKRTQRPISLASSNSNGPGQSYPYRFHIAPLSSSRLSDASDENLVPKIQHHYYKNRVGHSIAVEAGAPTVAKISDTTTIEGSQFNTNRHRVDSSVDPAIENPGNTLVAISASQKPPHVLAFNWPELADLYKHFREG